MVITAASLETEQGNTDMFLSWKFWGTLLLGSFVRTLYKLVVEDQAPQQLIAKWKAYFDNQDQYPTSKKTK
jgi:hypothetical protein